MKMKSRKIVYKYKKSIFVLHRTLPSWVKISGLIILLCVVILCTGVVYLARNPEGAALFADNVLRPLIGSRSVIALEGVVFGAQDVFNHLHEHQPVKKNYQTTIKTVAVTSHPLALLPPQNISPYVDTASPIVKEGIWQQIADTNFLTTFIRTDAERPYAVVNLVYIPMKDTSIGAIAGIKYPGGTLGIPGTGMVPPSIQKSGSLLAAFNGGFQEKDGHFGMYADGTTYVPLLKGLATFFIYDDGQLELKPYDGKPLSSHVVVARQNGAFLVTDGQTNKVTLQGINVWAGTASGDYITWRSGLGITKNGDLIYAVGPSLTPTSLADALRLAGSVNAMQLDINAYWVRFMLYTWNDKAQSYTFSPLTQGLTDGGKAYLTGYEKDFFYLYKKQPIPNKVLSNLNKVTFSNAITFPKPSEIFEPYKIPIKK